MINISMYTCIYHPYNQNYIRLLKKKKKNIDIIFGSFINFCHCVSYMRLVCTLLCLMLISRVASGEDQLRLDLECGQKTKWRAKVEVVFWPYLVFKFSMRL